MCEVIAWQYFQSVLQNIQSVPTTIVNATQFLFCATIFSVNDRKLSISSTTFSISRVNLLFIVRICYEILVLS